MSLIELKVDRIQYSETQTGAYVLFLSEPVTGKKLPIVIGGMEAHSITIGLEKDIIPQRPLTHDLMKAMMHLYGINLKKVIINKFDQGIFYALLITEKDGIEKAIDSRTSDAVALAVRFDAPVFCESEILEEAGISLPGSFMGEQEKEKMKQDVDDEIEKLLEELDESEPENKSDSIEEDIQQILDEIFDSSTDDKKQSPEKDLNELEKLTLNLFGKKKVNYSKKEIESMMQTAIEEEQYERAGMLKRFIELTYEKK